MLTIVLCSFLLVITLKNLPRATEFKMKFPKLGEKYFYSSNQSKRTHSCLLNLTRTIFGSSFFVPPQTSTITKAVTNPSSQGQIKSDRFVCPRWRLIDVRYPKEDFSVLYINEICSAHGQATPPADRHDVSHFKLVQVGSEVTSSHSSLDRERIGWNWIVTTERYLS